MDVLTKEQKLAEILKCTSSPEYYLLNYGYVKTPKSGYVKFRLFDFQNECLVIFRHNRFVIILKSRQTGLSTIAAGYAAWLISFFKAKEVAIVADKRKNAQGFMRKVKTILNKSPGWLIPEITLDNIGSVELANGSRIEAHSTTSDSARSESLSLLIIDEAAAIESGKVEDLWAASYPTLSLGGSAIVISTPRGIGNWYHKQWSSAVDGDSDFVPKTVHWTKHPIYSENTTWVCQNEECGHIQDNGDIDGSIPCEVCFTNYLKPTSPWYETQKKQLNSDNKVAQEYDMDFLGSGDGFISDRYLKELSKNCKQPISVSGIKDLIWTWKEPQPGRKYLISADVARGDGGDFSTFHVIDIDNKEQVEEFRGKIPSDKFAQMLIEEGYKYNEAMLAVEANSIGYHTCLKIEESEYPNIFYSSRGTEGNKKVDTTKHDGMVPGFQTTKNSRQLIFSQLEEDIRNGNFIVHSSRLISELRTVIWRNGRPEAMSGYNDDLTIAAAIALYIISVHMQDLINYKEGIISSLNAISGHGNLVQDTMEMSNAFIRSSNSKKDMWTQVGPRGEKISLRWLIGK